MNSSLAATKKPGSSSLVMASSAESRMRKSLKLPGSVAFGGMWGSLK
jgi:hypothetical protein